MARNFLGACLVLSLALALASAFTLQCTFRTQSYTGLGSVYECFTNQTFSLTNRTITGIEGFHANGLSNGDVRMLRIDGGILRTNAFVPRGIDRYFRNLVGFYVQYSSMTALLGDDFDQMPKLQHVTIINSNLTTVAGELFQNTPNVTFVNFSSNNLTAVGRDLFKPLCIGELTQLTFQDNPCIDQTATTRDHMWALIANLRDFCPIREQGNATTLSAAPTTTTTIATTTAAAGATTTAAAGATTTAAAGATTTTRAAGRDDCSGDELCKVKKAIEEQQRAFEQQVGEAEGALHAMRSEFRAAAAEIEELRGALRGLQS